MKNFSLAVWYLSLTNHVWGWTSESSTARLPPSNSLCLYYMSPENHILKKRNAIDSNASLNWKIGYTIWTFHWRLCCSTKNITITAFIGSQAVERAETFQRETIAKNPIEKQQATDHGMWWERCPSLMWVPRWEAPLPFPRILLGVLDQMSTDQRIVVCNMNGQKRTTVAMTWVRVQHNIQSKDSYREIHNFIWVQSIKTHGI